METSDLIARASAGDHDAFRELVEVHSRELQVHCYRILGSLQDAEDALQETLVAAWRNLGDFRQQSSLRTWLYQIATNRCLSMLRASSRRPRTATPLPDDALPEPTGVSDAPPWLEPYPDVLLDNFVDHAPGPETRYETTEAISLAFITALQLLPPRQRAVLVLRDVLGYHASEVARMLDATQESVQSALKRARATVDSQLADPGTRPARQPDTAAERHLVAELTGALERADLKALVGLLVADVRIAMPPAMLEYRGIDMARRFFAAAAFPPGRSYRVVPTRANGQPALGMYVADPHTGAYRAYGLLVITIAGDRIAVLTGFGAGVLPRFGLPRTLGLAISSPQPSPWPAVRRHCYRAGMGIRLSESAIRLIDGRNYAVLATVNADGSPQTSVMWIGRDGDDVLFSTVEGRLKHRNMVRDPRVSVTVIESADPENYVELRGIASMTIDVGRAFDTSLSWKYDGKDPGEDKPGAVRVIVRVEVLKAAGYAA